MDLILELQEGLAKNFKDVSVKVTPCPDLTKKPFGLAAKGKQNPIMVLKSCRIT